MPEDMWDWLNGPVADDIERLNRASQMNVVAGLVRSLLAQQQRLGQQQRHGRPPIPDESALRLLHRTATVFLLAKPGQYRNFDVHVDTAGIVAFRGQPWRSIKRLMRRFFRDLEARWKTGDAVDVASYALWRLTWIHPFSNGNGRTAIAFAYACLCLKLGAWLPGKETIVDLITADPERCQDVLRTTDRGMARPTDEPDLGAIKAYLDDLLLRQMRTLEA
ncbi:MAG: Fic family protein [Bradyrhizobium sp.]